MTFLKRRKNISKYVIKILLIFVAFGLLVNYKPSEQSIKDGLDSNCDRNGEWETIERSYYFKRSSVFYFYDINIVRIYYMSNNLKRSNFNLKIKVNYFNRSLEQTLTQEKIHIKATWVGSKFRFSTLTANFSLANTLGILEEKKLEIFVTIIDMDQFIRINSSLKAKVKTMNSNFITKKNSLVCSKCFYLSEKEHYRALQWWLEINLKAGHDKIQFCIHSAEESFNKLISKYSKFLITKSLECLPNLLADPKKSKFFKSYQELGDHLIEFEIMNQLMVNECYLDNIDKYKYITVIDNDETIIPRAGTLRAFQENLVSSYPTNREFLTAKCKSGKIDLVNYLKSLKSKFDIKSPTSFYFKQGFYIKHKIVDKIMKHLSEFLVHDLTKLNQTKFDFEILVKNSTVQTNDFEFDYKFKIESRFDYEYAKKLVFVYQTIIKPFLEENGKILQKFSQNVDRFFMVSGKVNNFAWGKSIHDTRRTFDMTVHHALDFFDRQKSVLYNDPFYLDEANAKYFTVDYDYGHLSHFRSRIHFKFEPMPINYLHVDLNYFNCYFKPILRKLSAYEA